MIRIRCRLAELLNEKRVTPEELAIASGLPRERIDVYCEGGEDALFLSEVGRIMSALGCARVSDLFEEVFADEPDRADDDPPIYEAEWGSPCPVSPDGRHHWYRDLSSSNTVYQEFKCQACNRKLTVIL